MMNINRDVVAFKRQADGACAAMKEAKGQIAMYCFDDAHFYIARAIELARTAGRDGIVARLSLQRDQITRSYNRQQEGGSQQLTCAGIDDVAPPFNPSRA